MYKIIFSIIVLFSFSSCVKDIKPWQKNIHAKDIMKDGGLDQISTGFQDHIYFSKEATKAGNGVSGGGCGCN